MQRGHTRLEGLPRRSGGRQCGLTRGATRGDFEMINFKKKWDFGSDKIQKQWWARHVRRGGNSLINNGILSGFFIYLKVTGPVA